MEEEEINDNDTIKCDRCQKNWYGWAIKENNLNCPDCNCGAII